MARVQKSQLHRLFVLLCFCFFAFLWSGCEKTEQGAQTNLKYEIDKSYSKGPLTVHIRLDKSKITIAETLQLELETAIGSGYEVNMPEIDAGILQNFGIIDWHNLPDRLDANNNVVSSIRYRLEPFLSGNYTIPAFTFTFKDVNEQDGKTYELITEPLDVEVASLLGQQREKLTIADIEGVVNMPGRAIWWWGLSAAAAVALGVAMWWCLQKQKTKTVQRIYKPAHEVAFAKLQALVNRDLIKQGRVKEFYQGISDILRHYIEDRFELKAPERTTEEFLIEIHNTGILSDEYRKSLGEFLTHCDLVKFARYAPTTEQIQKTFDLAKYFIEQTKSQQCQIDVTEMVASQPLGTGAT